MFFYQTNRIISEIGLKRTRLETIKAKFVDYGLIVERKGPLNKNHYLVTKEFMINYISDYVKKPYQEKFLEGILNLDFKSNEVITNDEKYHTFKLLEDLNNIYNAKTFSHISDANEVYEAKLELDYNKKTIYQLNLMRKKYELQTISRTFECFIDALLNGNDSTSNILNNFTSYDEYQEDFPVFIHYNNLVWNEMSSRF